MKYVARLATEELPVNRSLEGSLEEILFYVK